MLQFTVVHCNWPAMMEIGVCFFLCVVSMFCFSKMKRSWITQMVICTSVVELLAYVYYKMRSQKPKKKVLLPKGKIGSHLLPSSSFLMKHILLRRPGATRGARMADSGLAQVLQFPLFIF